MFKYGYSFPGSTFNKPYIDSKILNQMNEHGIMEVYINMFYIVTDSLKFRFIVLSVDWPMD